MALKKCKECAREISDKADKCPNCGSPQKGKQYGCGTLILILVVLFIFISLFAGNKSTTPPITTPAVSIRNEQFASPSDLSLTKKFLLELPPACSNSSADTSPDGTVTIRLDCLNSDKATKGIVKIKNGIVKDLR